MGNDDNVLYEDPKIVISVSSRDAESHDVYITRTDNAHLLQRGILKDSVESRTMEDGWNKLFNSNPMLIAEITGTHSYDQGRDLMFPLIQARLTEVKQERDHWGGEYNEARNQKNELQDKLDTARDRIHQLGPKWL